jgi:hypothetical protein
MAGDLPFFVGQLLDLGQRVMDSGYGIIPTVLRADHLVGFVNVMPPHEQFKNNMSLKFFQHIYTP